MRILSRICTGIGALLIFFSYGALDAVDNLTAACLVMLFLFIAGCLCVWAGFELDYIPVKSHKKGKVPALGTNKDKHKKSITSNGQGYCNTESEAFQWAQ